MSEKTPLSPIPEIDEEEFAIAEAKDIEKDRDFTVMMGGEELLTTTIYIHNVNKAIKRRIDQYNAQIGQGLTKEEANRKLERFVTALHGGLVLFKRTYESSLELRSDGVNYSTYVKVPDLSELSPTFLEFFDNFVTVTKRQLRNYIVQPISEAEKRRKAQGLQQQIMELANAMLRSTGRVLSINDDIIVGGKKTRQKRRINRSRKK